MSFEWYATILVVVFLIRLNPLRQRVHRYAGRLLQVVAAKQMTINDGREDIACSWEVNRYLFVWQEEVFIGEMVVACHCVMGGGC